MDGRQETIRINPLTRLSEMIIDYLIDHGISQTQFVKRCNFDQGLLSKIVNLNVNKIGLETYLKLAIGLQVDPGVLFRASGREDLEQLVERAYRTKEERRAAA